MTSTPKPAKLSSRRTGNETTQTAEEGIKQNKRQAENRDEKDGEELLKEESPIQKRWRNRQSRAMTKAWPEEEIDDTGAA